jgi:hypothetical protein
MTVLTRLPRSNQRPVVVVPYRVLVVADATCTARDVYARVKARGAGAPVEVVVIAPVHAVSSHGYHWIVDENAGREDAHVRLEVVTACLRKAGVRAEARFGDADPVQAIADALEEFPADEIFMFTRPLSPSGLFHHNVVDRARRLFSQPIDHVLAPANGR